MCNRAVGGILSKPVLLCHSLLEPLPFVLLAVFFGQLIGVIERHELLQHLNLWLLSLDIEKAGSFD